MATAVICEFNPFHNGHKYLLEQAKKLRNEPVIAVMSGSFTQRGEPAFCSKFERARTALENGADLVLELPTVYAVACAQRFAQGGVDIAKSFGEVNYLAFGCETDDIALLRAAADALGDPKVNGLIADKMKNGAYYPQAVERAVREVLGDGAGGALASPNNILAVEYLRALGDSKITPLPIKRAGAAHDGSKTSADFASASYIRGMLRSGKDASSFLPSVPKEITYPENFERAFLMKLRSLTAEDLKKLPETGEGLENRILDAAGRVQSVEELLTVVKTKRYTHARLRRILACAFLGLTEELQTAPADYVRVLGFTDEGEQILRSCRCEIVTSVAKALRKNDGNTAHLRLDIRACDIAALAYDEIMPSDSDYCTRILRENREK